MTIVFYLFITYKGKPLDKGPHYLLLTLVTKYMQKSECIYRQNMLGTMILELKKGTMCPKFY